MPLRGVVLRGVSLETPAPDAGRAVKARGMGVASPERVGAVLPRRQGVVDVSGAQSLADVTTLAAYACQAPIALLHLVDGDGACFPAGLKLNDWSPLEDGSFDPQPGGPGGLVVVPDALADLRFLTNPFVLGEPHLRAYAGAPVRAEGGHLLGTLSVVDTASRPFTSAEIEQLQTLARQVAAQLELRRTAAGLAAEVSRWRALVEKSTAAVAVMGIAGRFEYDNPQAAKIHALGKPAELLGQFGADDLTSQAAKNALGPSESRWRSLFEASPVAISLTDENGLFAAVNNALCELLGRPEHAIIGHRAAEFTHPDDQEEHRQSDERLAPSEIVRTEERFLQPDGQIRWAAVTLANVEGPDGKPWTLAHVLDITDRKAKEMALADSEANLRAVIHVVKNIQSGADARQTVVDECRTLARAAHVALLEPVTGQTALHVTASTDPAFLDAVIKLDTTSGAGAAYLTGAPRFFADAALDPLVSPAIVSMADSASLYAVPVRSGEETVGVLAVDWTERVPDLDDSRAAVVTLLADHAGVALRQASLIAELDDMAHTDTLTGLLNRRGWQQSFDLQLSLCRRGGQPLTIAMADVDHFKRFNDRYGHPAGDDLLVRFAEAGSRLVRESDTFARWGGEEFALALPNCDSAHVTDVLERLREAMPGAQTCSIGHATLMPGETAEHLLARADAALYLAKTSGRNRIVSAAAADLMSAPSA